MLIPGWNKIVGCAVRTENKIQAIDTWCAWRTLQTAPPQTKSLGKIMLIPGWNKIKEHLINSINNGRMRRAHRK